ncbi:MAG: phage portal protein [Alphaproteobacteria bacterium]|nr:phage portal protein [Alphaproteobacteria bacterium]
MGLIERIASFAGFERRDAAACIEPSWAALSQGYYASGLSPRAAESLATVLACVTAISSALAYVPALTYRRDGQGDRTEQPGHPLSLIVRNGVNDGMTWPDFMEHLVASTLLQGNGLAIILRDGRGQLEGFRFAPWNSVSVAELTSGRLAYDVSDTRGGTRRYLQGEVVHLRTRTDDGKVGRSVLSRAAETVSTVAGANNLAGSMLRNGAFPSGFLTAPGTIDPATAARLKATWDSGYSGDNAGKIAVAGDGLEWKSLQISPEDAELLESRKFGVIEICRLFQVPPPIVQAYENSTFTNAAQAGLWFATFCLSPWARKIEAEFARSVFPSGSSLELELDLSGFLRGDPQTRWATYDIAAKNSILTVDEMRANEGYGPMPKVKGPTPD